MNIRIGKQSVQRLADSGASISAICEHLLSREAPEASVTPASLSNIVGVCGEIDKVLVKLNLNLNVRA